MADSNDFLHIYMDNIRQQYRFSAFPIICESATPKTVHTTCRDGVKLTTDVYTPTIEGPYPTIIVRCPYVQQRPLWQLHGQELSSRGYALICQWCRGTHTSEGIWEPNINERKDGADLLQWCEQQDWIHNIGLWGTSYLALTCWTIADITTPKVRSICANHYGTDRAASAYQQGAFRSDVLTAWAMQNAGHPVSADYLESALYHPHINVDEDLWGTHLAWYRDWISHPQYHDPYWDTGFWGLLKSIPSRVHVPMLIHEGWFDHHLGSTLASYQSLNPISQAHSWLRIGCWNHYFNNPLEGLHPEHLDAQELPTVLKWFDLTLKQDVVPDKNIEFYEIGADTWHTADAYPVTTQQLDTHSAEVHPSTANAATQSPTDRYITASKTYTDPNGTQTQNLQLYFNRHNLSATVDPTPCTREYVYNPDNPVPTIGGEALLTTMDQIGARVQPAPDWRNDVLSFISEPFKQDIHINGSITVELYVSTDVPDTAFTAKIICVDPDGTARNYRTSITTLSFETDSKSTENNTSSADSINNTNNINHIATVNPYKPGDIQKVTIRMWDICWMIPAGSSLRCDISSSDFPQYVPHTNYAGLWSTQSKTQIAHQAIHMGRSTPSCITLPLSHYSLSSHH